MKKRETDTTPLKIFTASLKDILGRIDPLDAKGVNITSEQLNNLPRVWMIQRPCTGFKRPKNFKNS